MSRRERIRRHVDRRARALALLAGAALASGAIPARPQAPATLADTGLYADFATRALASDVLPFAPQYPLWTDGARKRRWIALPPGATIDASNPDVWSFPVGTRVWKEFAFERPVETRYMEKLADGSWLYATYLWSADGTSATLAPLRGVRGVAESAPGVRYDVPGVAECRACHGGHPAGVLGFSALQLSSDRDPLAPHAEPPPPGAADLERLIADGRLAGLPAALAARAPRVRASSPRERAALGYLHGNCSSCHNARGPLADLGLSFAVTADGEPEALATAVGRVGRYRPHGAAESLRIAPGAPEESLVLRRLGSREPMLQMPPMSTRAVDAEAVALVTAWIRAELEARPASVKLVAAHAAADPEEKP